MINKYIFIIVLAIISSTRVFAQSVDHEIQEKYYDQIDVLYNLSHIGNQILLNYNHHWNRHAVVLGVKYMFNSEVNPPYSRFIGWRFYKSSRDSFVDRLGLSLGYEYHLFKTAEHVYDPYVYAQVQHENYISVRNPDVFFAPTGPYTVFEGVVWCRSAKKVL